MLMRFKPQAVYIQGKDMVIADTLSRSPLKPEKEETALQNDVDVYVHEIISSWPVSDTKLNQIQEETQKLLTSKQR